MSIYLAVLTISLLGSGAFFFLMIQIASDLRGIRSELSKTNSAPAGQGPVSVE